MFPSGFRWPFVLLALVATSPFAFPGGSVADAGDDASTVCPGATTQDGVIVCPRLFAGKNPLRMPVDPSPAQRHGAFMRGGQRFYTRGGSLPLSTSVADEVRGSSGRPEYPSTVYLATIADGKVTEIQPKVRVAENAVLDAAFAGRVMEGTIGTADGPGRFNTSKTLRVRIEFADHAAKRRLNGTIVNAKHAVRASTGKCLPALAANRRRNPLRDGFSAKVALQRHPSMHGPFNDEMLLVWNSNASNMGTAFFPSIATLLGADPLGKRWDAFIHGNPTAGPALKLRLVADKGGKRC